MGSEKQKEKGSMTWIVPYIVLFIVFIGIGFAVSFVMPKMITHERTIDVQLLKSEVKEISELASLQYDYREIIDEKMTKTVLKKNIVVKAFYMTFDGTIKAGVDLNDVDYDVKNPESGSNEPPTVIVKMPEAKVLSHEDKNEKTVYEEGVLGKGIAEKRNKAISEKMQAREQQFIADGNLDKAKEQAQDTIESFIKSAYGDDVIVEFEDK